MITYIFWKKYGKLFVDGEYENDIIGFYRLFFKYPLRWQRWIFKNVMTNKL